MKCKHFVFKRIEINHFYVQHFSVSNSSKWHVPPQQVAVVAVVPNKRYVSKLPHVYLNTSTMPVNSLKLLFRMKQKYREVRVGVVKEYQEKKCVKWKTNSVRPSGCSSVVLSLFDGKARSVRCYVALLSVCLTVAWDIGLWLRMGRVLHGLLNKWVTLTNIWTHIFHTCFTQ